MIMTSFYHNYQSSSVFCFLLKIMVIVFQTSGQGLTTLKAKTKRILVIVVKCRHREDGLRLKRFFQFPYQSYFVLQYCCVTSHQTGHSVMFKDTRSTPLAAVTVNCLLSKNEDLTTVGAALASNIARFKVTCMFSTIHSARVQYFDKTYSDTLKRPMRFFVYW